MIFTTNLAKANLKSALRAGMAAALAAAMLMPAQTAPWRGGSIITASTGSAKNHSARPCSWPEKATR